MNDDDFRNVKSFIRRCCRECNELELVYYVNTNQLYIWEIDNIFINKFKNFSLTNFKKLLSLLKNDKEMKYYGENINNIKVYL